jgi:hypothetical protein
MTDNDLKVLDEILTCGNSQHTGQDIRRSLDDFGFEIRKRSIFERVLKVFMESNLDVAYWIGERSQRALGWKITFCRVGKTGNIRRVVSLRG